MRRYLETLFRLKEVFLIPALAVPVIALLAMVAGGKDFEVKSSVWVEPNPLSDPAALSRTTANVLEAQALEERLATEFFRKEVMDKIGLTDAIQRGYWPVPSQLQLQLEGMGLTQVVGLRGVLKVMGLAAPASKDEAIKSGLDMIKNSIHVVPDGSYLLYITYKGKEPQLGQQLIIQIIDLYNQIAVQNRVNQQKASLDLYTQQTLVLQDKVSEAEEAIRQYYLQHPAPPAGTARPALEQAELDSLDRAASLQRTLYANSLSKLQQVRVEGDALVTGRKQYFQIVDTPSTPDSPRFTTRSIVAMIILGLTLGVGLGFIPIIIFTWMDNTVRSKKDIEELIGTPIVAEIPIIPSSRRQRRGTLRTAIARLEAHLP